ncbi:phosphatidylinositol phosphate synthase [Cellulomonas sp. URHE0023]|uniref:phosphatidylinositol phosphate synthase n=1 Tax=Cellulomonas sp. URHE0023 TaxID=1380354 RepID=UPI00048731A9|nr:CDP-alcohol phosphatidyltransferase family protein [Cellulomonas sp. URHE0023]
MLNGLRGAMTRLFTPLATLLLRLGVSPDAVTIGGTLVVVTTALWAFPTGNLLLGTLIITVFVLTDSLDGVMARQAGRSGPWGAFLDSTMDRFGDGAIFAGLVLWFTAGGDDRLTAVLALVCLVLGSIVPYARARAEGLGMTASGGIAERADRLLLVLVATAVVGMGAPTVVLTIILVLLAVASAITIVQRVSKVYRQAAAGTTP